MTAAIKIGTCAWADRILVETGWYPPHVRSPEAKLRYYASQFSIVEIGATYWAFPDRARVTAWVERTPPGFTMNVKAHALLTKHYASVRGLPRDIRESLSPELLAKPHVYPRDLEQQTLRELERRFRDALEPMHEAGKLGVVLFQFPVWFPISADHKAELIRIRDRYAPYRVAVELRNRTWASEDNLYETLELLASEGLIYTCVDEPQGFTASIPPVAAATSELAVVRMLGRNPARFDRRSGGRGPYRYSLAELAGWVPKILALAAATREVHVLMGNGPLDQAIDNARQLADFIEVAQGHGVSLFPSA